jgi:hypothetical protein
MHDIKHFRESAERCEQLASEGPNESIRKLFLEIAARWRRLASEIEAEAKQEQSGQTELEGGAAS